MVVIINIFPLVIYHRNGLFNVTFLPNHFHSDLIKAFAENDYQGSLNLHLHHKIGEFKKQVSETERIELNV
jgi:hypothetical protein